MDNKRIDELDKKRSAELENQVRDLCRSMSLMTETERLAVLVKLREIAARD